MVTFEILECVRMFIHLKFAHKQLNRHMEVACSKRRNSYAREFSIVKWYYKNDKHILHTSHKFEVDRKQVRNWIKTEEKIQKQKLLSKASGRGRSALFPEAEKLLHDGFVKMPSEGKIVKKMVIYDSRGTIYYCFLIGGSKNFVAAIAVNNRKATKIYGEDITIMLKPKIHITHKRT